MFKEELSNPSNGCDTVFAVETSSLKQLQARGCEVAQTLLETPEMQRGFEVVQIMRRLATLYNMSPSRCLC